MTLDLDALEALAKAATRGAYRVSSRGDKSGFVHVYAGTEDGPGQTIAQWMLPADAAHLATFDPPCVQLLIARIRQLESALVEACNLAERWSGAQLYDTTEDDDRIAELRKLVP